ncbi:androgen-induced gene 1 protein isoform X2 [Hydra vulgaris]|uniref:Androgen-induced gene 1 protein isoform X2 n=1 Tax=Hydra vulgaris TaxID=6087 RepID=A0ABM4B9T1_HYDVU
MTKHSFVTTKSLFIHLVGFVWCSFGTYNGHVYYSMPSYQNYGGRFQFLTMWASYLLYLGTAIGTLVDSIHLKNKNNENKHLKSPLLLIRDDFSVVWGTLNCLVPILYWSVAYFDREGIHPKELQHLLPFNGWYNHYLHTIPAFYVLLAITNVNYAHPPLRRAIVYIVTLFLSYLCWLIWLANLNGVYAYPFLNALSKEGFVVFIIGSCLVGFLLYIVLKSVSTMLWKTCDSDALRSKLKEN